MAPGMALFVWWGSRIEGGREGGAGGTWPLEIDRYLTILLIYLAFPAHLQHTASGWVPCLGVSPRQGLLAALGASDTCPPPPARPSSPGLPTEALYLDSLLEDLCVSCFDDWLLRGIPLAVAVVRAGVRVLACRCL